MLRPTFCSSVAFVVSLVLCLSAPAALQDEHVLLLAAHEDLKQKHEQQAGQNAVQNTGPQASVAQLQVGSSL